MEEFEFDSPCDIGAIETNDPPCDQAAKWVLIYNCGHDRQFCSEHKDYVLAMPMFYCVQCYPLGTKKDGCRPGKVVACEPISGHV